MKYMRFYIPGILLVLTGFLVVAVPEILVALIASIIVIAGMCLLYIGHLLRKATEEDRIFFDTAFEEVFPEYNFIKSPLLKMWVRKW